MQQTDKQAVADDIVRIRQSTLISLNRDAKKIPLRPRKITAKQSGAYLASFKGRGMELDNIRPYQIGDDVFSIDWKATARTGEAHTKIFREERERPVLMWVDYRQPMFFATRGSFKSVVAAKIAALLSWSAIMQGDRLGGLVFSEKQQHEVRPSRGKAAALYLIEKLTQHRAWDDYQAHFQQIEKPAATENHTSDKDVLENSAAEALHRLRHIANTGNLIFLISDFRYLDALSERYLAAMSHHNDIVMIAIHDPLESRLPMAGYYRFSNGVTSIDVNTHNKKIGERYRQQFKQRQRRLKKLCRKQGMFYLSISTEDDFIRQLQIGLGMKRR